MHSSTITRHLLGLLIFGACLLVLIGCSDSDEQVGLASHSLTMPQGKAVQISIDPSEEAGTLDERYIGFSLDTVQFTGGYWWSWGP